MLTQNFQSYLILQKAMIAELTTPVNIIIQAIAKPLV